ncbi:hypothetical protein IT418_00100 [bacterium]|nr:hypothetical protein [bacterium]
MKKIFITILLTMTLSMGTAFAQTTVTPTPTPTRIRTEVVGDKIKQAALRSSKAIASRIFQDHFLKKLNALRIRVANNPKLGEDAKKVLLGKIDGELLWFTEQKEKVEAATTVAQVREYTKVARLRFLEVGKDVRKLYFTHWFVVSLERVVKRIEESILPKIETKLNELANKGIDVTAERVLFDKAKLEVSAAKQEINEIRNSTTYDMARKNYNEARLHIKAMRETLKELLTGLKDKV